MSVYEDNAFDERVRYAKECLVTGQTDSRKFVTCFEMLDGDLVMLRLLQDAENDELLAARLQRYDIAWLRQKLYPLLKNVPPSDFVLMAKTLRDRFQGDIRSMLPLLDSGE